MTKQQRKVVFKMLYVQPREPTWNEVYTKVCDTYKWEKEYDIIIDIFDKHKRKWTICYECGISERTYDYWLSKILEVAFLWATELKAL